MASLDDEHLILLDPDDENDIRRNNVDLYRSSS